MQTPEVVWWGSQRGSWCHGIVEWLLQGFTHHMRVDEVEGDGAIVVVKADWLYSDGAIKEFHSATVKLKWLLLVVTANEEGHPSIADYQRTGLFKKWLQTPHRHQTADRYLPWGWTPNCSIDVQSKKDLDYSFAGQITHKRRWDLKEAFPQIAKAVRKWEFHGSDGFAKGISPPEYYGLIGRSKFVPCPSGPFTVDSMRVCEALQLGAIPILDAMSPTGEYWEYWDRVFGSGHPLPIMRQWSAFPLELELLLNEWPELSKRISFWWAKYKAGLQAQLMLDLHELGAM